MKKYTIGFDGMSDEERDYYEGLVSLDIEEEDDAPRKSLVHVYFPSRNAGWTYYNDSFNLKVGDLVFVEGKLEGQMGRVTEVNYSFKIKPSDYKKVISVVDVDVKGNFYPAGSHMITFDENALPFEKVLSWFKAPSDDEEYIVGDDYVNKFHIDDLSSMNISGIKAERGHEYFMENRVCYVCLKDMQGYAIVLGSEPYEVEFKYADGEISNIKCTCLCNGTCKHEFAAMLQLKELLDIIEENYVENYYLDFAAISKKEFMNTIVSVNSNIKISI